MVFTIGVEPQTIDKNTVYTVQDQGELFGFPVLTIGRDSYIHDAFILTSMEVYGQFIPYNFQVGKYTSIAPKVTIIIDNNHDYLAPCQGRPREVLTEQNVQNIQRKGQILIENDCWIGMNATILSGVTVGNGAVVAANSVVTKDVPPYAIVAGNPARIIKYRFEPDVIHKLLEIEWWNWSSERLTQEKEYLVGNIELFAEKCYSPQKKDGCIKSFRINENNKQYLYCFDIEQHEIQLNYIIEEFCKSFSNKPCELMIYYKNDTNQLALIKKNLSKYEQYNIYINLLENETDSEETSNEIEESIIEQTDYFITSSYTNNLCRVGFAERHGVEVVSGFNIPLFEN